MSTEIESKPGRQIDPSDIKFRKMLPLQHMHPHGLLPLSDESSALWYFLVCAMQALSKVEQQTTLEGDQDQQADLMQIAHSVRMIYELDSLEGMFGDALVSTAKREAGRSMLAWDSRLDAFFASGGKAYRHLDRDADKVGL